MSTAAPPSAPAASAPTTPAPAPKAPASSPAASTAPQGATSLPKDPPAAPAAETPTQQQARILKYKVDGAEKEVDLASLPETELVKRFQMAEAAQKRMQEAAEYRKAFEQFVSAVKEDPFSALKDPVFGLDLDQLAQQRLLQQFEQEQLPESERKALELQRQLEAKQAELDRIAQERQAAQQAQLEQQVIDQTYKDFEAALATEKVPKSRTTMRMMAEVAMEALDNGIELTPQQIAAEVNERLGGMTKHVFASMKGDALFQYLGEDVVREVLRHSVERARGRQSQPPAAEPPPPAQPPVADEYEESKPQRRMQDLREWKAYLRR